MSVLRRLYRYLARYKAWAIVAFGSMIIFAASQTALMSLISPLVDDVLKAPDEKVQVEKHESRQQRIMNEVMQRDRPVAKRDWLQRNVANADARYQKWWNGNPADKWKRVLAAFLLVFVVRAFASFFSEYGFQKVGLATVRDLRNELYERIINQSHRFFAERSTGEMVSRLVSDADAIQAAVSTRMGDLFQESITLIGLLVYIFLSNTELALISFVVAPLLVWPVVSFGLRLRRTTHRSQERMAD